MNLTDVQWHAPTQHEPCSECTGAWLYSATWQHRLTCSLAASLDRTRAADHDRGTTERPATLAELMMLARLGWQVATPVVAVVEPGALWRRRFVAVGEHGQPVAGYDPEA